MLWIRLFIFIVLIILIYRLIKNLAPNNITPQLDKESQDTMVQCTHCQIHLPEAMALRHQKNFFCTLEHANLWDNAHHKDKET